MQKLRGTGAEGDWETCFETMLTRQVSHHFHTAHVNIRSDGWGGRVSIAPFPPCHPRSLLLASDGENDDDNYDMSL